MRSVISSGLIKLNLSFVIIFCKKTEFNSEYKQIITNTEIKDKFFGKNKVLFPEGFNDWFNTLIIDSIESLNCPILFEIICEVDMQPLQAELYSWQLIKNFNMISALTKNNDMPKALRMIKLLYLCSMHPMLLHGKFKEEFGIKEACFSKKMAAYKKEISSGKLEYLKQIIGVGLGKYIIYTESNTNSKLIKEYLSAQGINARRIHKYHTILQIKKLFASFNNPHSDTNCIIIGHMRWSEYTIANVLVIYDNYLADFNAKKNAVINKIKSHVLSQRLLIIRLISKYTVEHCMMIFDKWTLLHSQASYTDDRDINTLVQIITFGSQTHLAAGKNDSTIKTSITFSTIYNVSAITWKLDYNECKKLSYKNLENVSEFNCFPSEESYLINSKIYWSSVGSKYKTSKVRHIKNKSYFKGDIELSYSNQSENEKDREELFPYSMKLIHTMSTLILNKDCSLVQLKFKNCSFQNTNSSDSIINTFQICLDAPLHPTTSAQLITWGFSEINRIDFLKGLLAYGIFNKNWNELLVKIQRKSNSLSKVNSAQFLHYAKNFSIAIEKAYKNYQMLVSHVLTCKVNVSSILIRLNKLWLIDKIRKREQEAMEHPYKHSTFITANASLSIAGVIWKPNNDFQLACAILLHGYGTFIMQGNGKKLYFLPNAGIFYWELAMKLKTAFFTSGRKFLLSKRH
jgi:hypothetical protein